MLIHQSPEAIIVAGDIRPKGSLTRNERKVARDVNAFEG